VKAVILAGGFGTRITEETIVRPKPLIEIGGKPILWHIMKYYSTFGIDEFIICLGYKGYLIKEYFANYRLHTSDVTFKLGTDDVQIHRSITEPWTVTLVDTGDESMTGGRLRRVREYIGNATFCFTYGDGLADVDIMALQAQHRSSGLAATLTAVRPPGRFGAVSLHDDQTTVFGFTEKPLGDRAWINGGFFILEPSVIDLIDADDVTWERQPLETLASRKELGAFLHDGFFQALDTLRDKNTLEALWQSGSAPWKRWV
jgi:glucose-1-phosphate cytidylyltransferase